MTGTFRWGTSPRQRIEAACSRLGRDTVVTACLDLLAGRDVDAALVQVLGGPHAHEIDPDGVSGYWRRVWAARGLLWAWDDRALPGLLVALHDEAWRVREMAAKVVARHQLDDAGAAVADLRTDPVPRVRAAASRALVRLTG